MKHAIIHLTASATAALPRWILFAICITYSVTGLWGRDPWKNEDAAGFGVMWTLANGSVQDWLFPNLVGRPVAINGPLVYWLGATLIRMCASWLNAADAARITTPLLFCMSCVFIWYGSFLLGRRPEIQPFKYAFGGEPATHDYGRTLADGALLILLACFGLAERGHETTPEMAQFACIAMLLYGLIRSLDRPWQGAVWWGSALGLLVLAADPVLGLFIWISSFVFMGVKHIKQMYVLLRWGTPIAIALAAIWPLMMYMAAPQDARSYLYDWGWRVAQTLGQPLSQTLLYALKNLSLFTWPAWPLAAWSWYYWKGLRNTPHITIPLSVLFPILLLIGLHDSHTNRLFLLLLPALSILAAFGLPALKRGAMDAIDWFALISFTFLGSFVWLVWLAAQTGFPTSLARNLVRLVPGFQAQFNLYTFVIAIGVTICWAGLVYWRLAHRPKVLWRSVALSSSGTTLMWVLLMTLWLPFVNYSRTYKEVALQISAALPSHYQCIQPIRLGNAQLASFAYFGKLRFSFKDEKCDIALLQKDLETEASIRRLPYTWKLIWQGRRVTDRDEKFLLFMRNKIF